jgi:hypothetical protein
MYLLTISILIVVKFVFYALINIINIISGTKPYMTLVGLQQ